MINNTFSSFCGTCKSSVLWTSATLNLQMLCKSNTMGTTNGNILWLRTQLCFYITVAPRGAGCSKIIVGNLLHFNFQETAFSVISPVCDWGQPSDWVASSQKTQLVCLFMFALWVDVRICHTAFMHARKQEARCSTSWRCTKKKAPA